RDQPGMTDIRVTALGGHSLVWTDNEFNRKCVLGSVLVLADDEDRGPVLVENRVGPRGDFDTARHDDVHMDAVIHVVVEEGPFHLTDEPRPGRNLLESKLLSAVSQAIDMVNQLEDMAFIKTHLFPHSITRLDNCIKWTDASAAAVNHAPV